MIDRVLSEKKVIVTSGTGGVGKTTLSAALGVRLARLGKRAVVVTLDPAKRLADAMGVKGLGDAPEDLTPSLRTILPELPAAARLAAVMPDTRKTLEAFVRSIQAERALDNPIFEIFAREFSGANEYMAMQQLVALQKSDEYDCIILDTPPSQNMLSFLQAPGLLARMFDERLIHWVRQPASKLASAGVKGALSVLERLTGSGFMADLFDLGGTLFEARARFSSNLKYVTELMLSPHVGFVAVVSPSLSDPLDIRHFVATLSQQRYHFEGLILNRGFSMLPDWSSKGGLGIDGDPGLALLEALRKKEEAFISRLKEEDLKTLASLPELARDVHSLEDLVHVSTALVHDLNN